MRRVDPAVLDDRLRSYTGDRLRWSGHYVAAGDRHVLALVVDAPRRRDPVYLLQRGSADESGRELPVGTVFVRKGGRTVPADEADIERLGQVWLRTLQEFLGHADAKSFEDVNEQPATSPTRWRPTYRSRAHPSGSRSASAIAR